MRGCFKGMSLGYLRAMVLQCILCRETTWQFSEMDLLIGNFDTAVIYIYEMPHLYFLVDTIGASHAQGV